MHGFSSFTHRSSEQRLGDFVLQFDDILGKDFPIPYHDSVARRLELSFVLGDSFSSNTTHLQRPTEAH